MAKKLLNPLIISAFIVTMLLGSFAHLMYGSCQTTKWHYLCQAYWMPENLPLWMQAKAESDLTFGFEQKYTGTWKTWYRNGQVHLICNVLNGKENGYFEIWNESNYRQVTGERKNGHLVIYKVWDRDSKLIKIFYYDSKGAFVKREIYQNSKVYQVETEENIGDDLIISTFSSDKSELIHKEYRDKFNEFQKRELFEKGKLVKTEIEEFPE